MFVLDQTPTAANHFIAELRDVHVQRDRMRFRKNLERLGTILAYEISKALPYEASHTQTPLGTAPTQLLQAQPVLITIMRAGLPFYQGFLHVFDQAENAFIGAFRSAPGADNSFHIEMGYLASPSLAGKQVILIDPMLATGKSLVKAYRELVDTHGAPAHTHVAAAIASAPGVAYLQEHIEGLTVWVGALDAELNSHSYIVPGLGDAGDLSFGEKL
jgi:uracil phosphoribosyltransferase